MSKTKETTRKVTRAMRAGAKPACFSGLMFGKGKAKWVCWPGVRFPGERAVVVLEQRQCRSTEAAIARAKRILADRSKWSKP